MSAARPDQNPYPAPFPTLLVELPSWPRNFLENLRDFIAPHRLPPLDLRSAPAAFWPDVFVQHRLPWRGFVKSAITHVVALAALVEFTRLLALQPYVEPNPAFQRAEVIHYGPSDSLPPLDTRQETARAKNAAMAKADPEFSHQAVISVPREPDSRAQTVVAPSEIKLNQDVALPNMVAWSDTPPKPQLEIPPVPLTASADIQRLAPQMSSVVAPPPPKNVERTLPSANSVLTTAPAVIGPPPSIEAASNRPLAELNIGRSAVIAPAPSLPVAEQRALPASRSLIAAQVVPPPPSVGSAAFGSLGASGRVIALNLHPAVGAPSDPPAGNRRGTFAATPEGHAGATGAPGGNAGNGRSDEKGSGTATNRNGPHDLPSGLYVGSSAGKTANSASPNLMASARPPRVSSSAKPLQADSASKLSEPERGVFGDRKFYSVTLNMPNLNSAGGSWVIRFAELDHSTSEGAANALLNQAAAVDLSQPMATRKVDPAYPLQLMRENVAGTVIVYAVIHADGTVGNVRVLRGVDGRLDRYASEAVAQWKFEPAMKAGVPVDVEATFRIPFRPVLNF